MSLLDGLKDSLRNPLAENNEDMNLVLESDFELTLEKAIDVKLSPADIAAILNGDDDIDDDEDDIDDPEDDIDKDTVKDLECAKEALESTMTELGIDTAADELDADDSDLEMDPEEDDEVISEEALIEMINALECDSDTNDATKVADTGDASIPKNSSAMPNDIDKPNHETGEASEIENIDDPTPDGDEAEAGKLEAECEALLAALESDDKPEVDHDPTATECDTTETGNASVIANTDDPTPEGDENDPASPVDNETKSEECDDACEGENLGEDDNVSVKGISEEENPTIPTEGDEDEDADMSLESILDALLENPI